MFRAFIIITRVVAFMLLISSASRASITGLMLWILAYSALTVYKYNSKIANLALITLLVMVGLVIIVSVDWMYIYELSGRGINYTTMPLLTRYEAWLTGFGFAITGTAEGWALLGIGLLDSFYLTTILQSGLIGFVFLMGGIIIFTLFYFKDLRGLTKLQRLTGALLIFLLYYGLFESVLFNFKPFILLGWTMLILCMNDMVRPKAHHRRHIA